MLRSLGEVLQRAQTRVAAAPVVVRAAAGVVGLWLAWVVAGELLPDGLPVGVVLLGVVLGSLSALTAVGLVLIYRSTRVINFAQAEMGGLASAVAVVAVAGMGLPYLIALPVGLSVAVMTGVLVDVVVVRRFFTAPRLILTVATLGVAQLIGAAQIAMPPLFSELKPLTTFTTPFTINATVGPVVFTGDHMMAVAVLVAVVLALSFFFGRTDLGVAIRGAADSTERAVLLGIPVRRLSMLSWAAAAGLSGLGSMLSTPILGVNLGIAAGPVVLLAPLAAAVIARMESLVVAFAAAILIGVAQQAVFWSYPRSSAVDVGLFALVMIGLLLQRKRAGRPDDSGLGGHVAVREVRPVPETLRRLPEVRAAKAALACLLAVLTIVVPLGLSDTRLTFASLLCIYGIIAVSLVVLTGWAGQISLGQFAFVGVGAAATGGLIVSHDFDAVLALAAAAAVGGATAVVIGIPALRIPGLFLAVATLAFAVPVSTYLLSSIYFPALSPAQVPRPALFGRIDLNDSQAFYFLCLAGLVVSLDLARNLRRSRTGRAIVAVRDNERGAASFSVRPIRAQLTGFVVAGAMAGFAGGLYVLAVRGISFSGFDPQNSIQVFTMVVVGGLGSLPGALLGAAYVQTVQYLLSGAAQLLATGTGLLLLLIALPGGLGQAMFSLRDRLLRRVAERRDISFDIIGERRRGPGEADERAASGADAQVGSPTDEDALLSCAGVDAGYGQVQILFDVSMRAEEGEIVALLGTNGAGKSTILRVIAGLLTPQRGRVVLDGRDITDLDAIDRVRAGLVTVPGGRGVFGSLTVAENLRLGAWLARRDTEFVAETTERIYELFPALERRQGQKASLLSGGEQQMLTIAQALLCRPRVLLIDELSLGLAPAVVAQLLDVVRSLNSSGVTVVVVEQSVNIAVTVAGRAVFMEKGEVRFTGPTTELTERPDLLRSVFLGGGTPAGERVAPRPRRDPGQRMALEVVGVRKRFGGVSAIDDVSISVAEGQVLGIIGSNGAGKTTLLDLCSGFLHPDGGRIELSGSDVTTLDAAGRAERGLGRVFQSARLFPSLTVVETIAVAFERHTDVRDPILGMLDTPASARSEADVRARVEELIERMHLERYASSFVAELSTGTRRVVELACALAHQPNVLLLDEPSSGIAQRETEALRDLLIEIKEATGTTMVVIEHDMPLVSAVSDELVCMHLGRVIARGVPEAVLQDPAVIASYLGEDDATVRRSGSLTAALVQNNGPSDEEACRMLTTAEFARIRGESVQSVLRRIRAGELTAVREGRRYLIPEDAVEKERV